MQSQVICTDCTAPSFTRCLTINNSLLSLGTSQPSEKREPTENNYLNIKVRQ